MIFLTSIILNNSIFSTAVLFKHVRILEYSKETTTNVFLFSQKAETWSLQLWTNHHGRTTKLTRLNELDGQTANNTSEKRSKILLHFWKLQNHDIS